MCNLSYIAVLENMGLGFMKRIARSSWLLSLLCLSSACIPEASLPAAVVTDVAAVKVGQRVDLDAAASTDKDKRPLSFAWRFVKAPKGSASAFSDARSATPSFVPDSEGEYVVGVVVSNGVRSTVEAQKIVTVSGSCIAKGGTVDADEGARVPIDVRTADGGCETATAAFRWELAARPAGSTAAITTDGSDPGLVPDIDGIYLLRYSVRFGTSEFGPPQQLTVNVRDCSPQPSILTDSLVGPANMLFFLDPAVLELAYAAVSPCGRAIAEVEWLPQSAPSGVSSHVVNAPLLSGSNGSYLTVPAPGKYRVGLRVVDEVGLASAVVEKDLIAFPNGAGLASSPDAVAAVLVGADERLAIAYTTPVNEVPTDRGAYYAVLNPDTGAFEVEKIGANFTVAGAPGEPWITLVSNGDVARVAFTTSTGVSYSERRSNQWSNLASIVTASPNRSRLFMWTHGTSSVSVLSVDMTGADEHADVLSCTTNCAQAGSWNDTPRFSGADIPLSSFATLSAVSNGTLTGYVWRDGSNITFRQASGVAGTSLGGLTLVTNTAALFNAPAPVATITQDGRVAVAFTDALRGIRVASCSQLSSPSRSFTAAAGGGNDQFVQTNAVQSSDFPPMLASSTTGADFVWWRDATNPGKRAAVASRAAGQADFGAPRTAPMNQSDSSGSLFPSETLPPRSAAVVTSEGTLRVVFVDENDGHLSLLSQTAR